MGLYIERHRAEQVLKELTKVIAPRIRAELQITPVSIGYGILITLKTPPAHDFEWIAVYRGIPVIYDQGDGEPYPQRTGVEDVASD